MAAQLLTIGGYIIGGPWGAFAGSLIGNLLFPPETGYSNKLTDTRVTYSTLGEQLAIIYGQIRTAGNVIASSEVIQEEDDSYGKGGDTPTMYKQFQTVAISLCEGEADVVQILSNSEVIYNMGADASPSTIIASSSAAKSIRIYRGTKDQQPDPILQALLGVKKTSRYKNTCYVVLERVETTKFGGRLPNLEFIVRKDGKIKTIKAEYIKTASDVIITKLNPVAQKGWQVDTVAKTITYCSVLENSEVVPIEHKGLTLYSTTGEAGMVTSPFDIGVPDRCKTDDGSLIYYTVRAGLKNFFLLKADGTQIELGYQIYDQVGKAFKFGDFVYIQVGASSFVQINFGTKEVKSLPIPYMMDMDATANYLYLIEGNYYGFEKLVVKKYDHNLNFISRVIGSLDLEAGAYITIDNSGGLNAVSDNEIYWNYTQPYGHNFIIEVSTGTPIVKESYDYQNDYSMSGENLLFDGRHFFSYAKISGYKASIKTLLKAVDGDDVDLSYILKDICLRAGMTEDQIDVSLIKDKVHGYKLASNITLKQAIEPLQQAYFFDTVVSGTRLKFVPRGGAIVATITADEVGVRAYGSEAPENVEVTRRQDVELPREVSVSYFDKNSAYQVGTQYARRQNVTSVNIVSVQLPVALTPDEACKVASVLLSEFWQGRETVKFNVSQKYSYLEPSDNIIVYKGKTRYVVRIQEISEQNNVLTISGVTEDVTRYDQPSVGASMPINSQEVELTSPTTLQFLDIPLLKSQDDKQGCYFVVSGYNSNWKGALITRSIDGGVSYNNVVSSTNKAVMGYTTTVLGDFYSGYMFDETNRVTVRVNGDLTSQQTMSVLNGANMAVIGDEILYFKNASQQADGSFILSGLLRGIQGTPTGNHTQSERFILIEDETLNMLNLGSNEYDLTRIYKATTFGDSPANATINNFTYKGMAQECLSPVHLGGGRNGSNDIILKWIRRGRINNSWNNKVDVPLGEDTEAYEIDILKSDGTVVRTLTSTTPTVTYTASQQTTDFGSTQTNIKFVVYQMSTLRGRGMPAYGSI